MVGRASASEVEVLAEEGRPEVGHEVATIWAKRLVARCRSSRGVDRRADERRPHAFDVRCDVAQPLAVQPKLVAGTPREGMPQQPKRTLLGLGRFGRLTPQVASVKRC